MSSIRRQSIISSVVIYFGFAIGLLNTYLFAREGTFHEEQFGLYNAFLAIATMMMAFANMAMPSYIYKFYPYYKAHLPDKKNDQVTWALLVCIIGFLFVVIAGAVFKGVVIRKYTEHSPQIVAYYNWIFVLGFGIVVYTVLEAYAWQLHKSVLTNYLKEVQWRFYTTILIVLFTTGIIPGFYHNFDLFIKLFSFSYPFIAVSLLVYLIVTKKIHFTFSISTVTRRFYKSIIRLCSFVYSGSLIFTISQVFDSLVIASKLDNALAKLAVYSVAQNIATLIQAPQRGIISAAIAHLSKAWKDKNKAALQRIYERSSINQLIFSCGLYILITINFLDAVNTFDLKETYRNGFIVFLLLGATKVIDMGTGVNSQIIGTSTRWKFEFICGVILLLMMIPLTFMLTIRYDIVGPALAGLISVTIYNSIRIIFLWKTFGLFPFTRQTIYTLLHAGACFVICYFMFRDMHGLAGLFARSIAFVVLYAAGAIYFRLSPDIMPVLQSIQKRLRIKGR
ncbi:MAG TPA: lipopolysaccharide biosynthesis protein [Chitinophagaceae bacterium]